MGDHIVNKESSLEVQSTLIKHLLNDIRAVPPIFLTLSRWFRRWRLDVLLPLLPGIRWMDDQHASLIVDKRVTRIFAKQVFHLFGYRSKSVSKDFYILKSRDATSKSELYQNERWWKSARRSS